MLLYKDQSPPVDRVVLSLLVNLIGLALWVLCEEIHLNGFVLHLIPLLRTAIEF